MDDKYYRIAKCVTNAIKCVELGDANGANNQSSLCKEFLLAIPGDQFYTKVHMHLVFEEFFRVMSLDPEVNFHFQAKSLNLIRDLYGNDHPVLSDICKLTSDDFLSTERFLKKKVL